jgi:hypothetical protein
MNMHMTTALFLSVLAIMFTSLVFVPTQGHGFDEFALWNEYVPSNMELFGRDYVQRSLNKRIIIHDGWATTEHRPANTGVDMLYRPNCPKTPRKAEGESWDRYTQRLRSTMMTWPGHCF